MRACARANIHHLAALAALCLSACGGGGAGGQGELASPAVAQEPAAPGAPQPQSPPLGQAPAPSPAPAPAAPPEPVTTSTSLQAVANGRYTVADAAETVVITLPPNSALQAGQTVRVAGQGAATWRLAQNAQQHVATTNLPGNVVPGTVWTPRVVDAAAPNQNWASIATSASGARIAAAASGGGIHVSTDGGRSWTRSNAPSGAWTALSMSQDGAQLAAVMRNGPLYTSGDGGLSWTARTGNQFWSGVHISGDGARIVAAGGGALWRSLDAGASFSQVAGTAGADWRAVAGSQDGQRLVAVASFYDGDPTRRGVYVSTDGGARWTRANTSGTIAPEGNWSFVSASADGMRMVALDNGAYPWVSGDGGVTWRIRFSYSGWSGVAVSGNGQVVSALEPRDDTRGYTGYAFVSRDGGGDNWEWYGENRWYRGVALSFDGNWIAVGDAGANGTGGLLYTSQGNRTAEGALGAIEGRQGQSIEVTYQGGGRFTVTQFAGGAFSIR